MVYLPLASEKRIPIHGDENTFYVASEAGRFFIVKKESPYMGTKTPLDFSMITSISIPSEKRIPIHGDEN